MCLRCSALSVLASSSGVASERAAFMGLVRNEIDRLNAELVNRGSVSMILPARQRQGAPPPVSPVPGACVKDVPGVANCGWQVPWCCCPLARNFCFHQNSSEP